VNGNPEDAGRGRPDGQGSDPETVVPFVPKQERVRPIIPRWDSGPPPSGQEHEPGDEDGDDPGPAAA
jgi:hypothetical protein